MIQFYVSGNFKDEPVLMDYLVAEHCHVLTSFAYPKMLRDRTVALAGRVRASGNWKIPHMIDSGAFTAWASGKVINLQAYARTCNELQQAYGDCMDLVFVSLDSIPGKKGRETTAEDVATACKESAANYDYLRKEVCGKVKPVFHTGDPEWLLAHYADADYISFGMSQNLHEEERVQWVVRNAPKAAAKKLHGLAATGHRMLRAAPWHSVDSAAWQYAASMGAMNWVKPSGQLLALSVSKESPKQKEVDGHVASMPDLLQEQIRGKLEAAGTSLEALRDGYAARWLWNIACYREACAIASQAPRLSLQEGLFDA